MARHSKSTPPPAPIAPADQARFDAVTRCRAVVDAHKRKGVEPLVLEQAVEALQAALAAAPDMPPPPPPPAQVEDTNEQDATEADADSAAPAGEQEN